MRFDKAHAAKSRQVVLILLRVDGAAALCVHQKSDADLSASLLFYSRSSDRRAAVAHARAAEQRHTLRVERHEFPKHRRGNVADVDQRDLAAALGEQRNEARSEGITKHDAPRSGTKTA